MVVIWIIMVCWGIWTVYWPIWDDSTKKFWSFGYTIPLLGHLQSLRQHQDDLQCPFLTESNVRGNFQSVFILHQCYRWAGSYPQSCDPDIKLDFAACALHLRSLLVCFFLFGLLLPYLSAVCCSSMYLSVYVACHPLLQQSGLSRYDEQDKPHSCQSCQEWGVPPFLGRKARVRTA